MKGEDQERRASEEKGVQLEKGGGGGGVEGRGQLDKKDIY